MKTGENLPKPIIRYSLLDDLLALWPGIRYLSFGVWLSWFFIAFSGTFWLSDVETDGFVLAFMYILSTGASAVVLLIAPFFLRQFKFIMNSRAFILGAGFLALIGSFFIILAGPYYLTSTPLFVVGDILTGIGTAVLTLKCGELYSELQPWRALIYALLSQLIIVVIFFFVLGNQTFHPIDGGPSLGGILALMFLPVIAALLLILKPTRPAAQSSEQPTVSYTMRIRALSPVFWKFLIAVFVFAFTTSIARSLYTNLSAPSALVSDTSNMMLFRILIFFVFLLLAIRFLKYINFGKPYLLFMSLIAVLIALSPLLRIYNETVTNIISFSFSVFDVLIWCLLAFIAFEKRISAIIVFGFGRGIFMAGSAIGWIIGTQVKPQIIGSNLELVIYIIMALLILISVTLVFSERDFYNLFSAISEIEVDLEDVSPDLSSDQARIEKDLDRERPYLTACKNVGELAKLSTREQHILELLALGRGSENIAKRLSISLNTVRTHTHNIYAKLDVHSRQELIDLIENNRNSSSS